MAEIKAQNSRNASIPGADNQVAGIWLVESASNSDTFKVPQLSTRSATVDQSSVRVLSPATGVTVTAGAVDANGEHTLTISGSAAGQQLIILALHQANRLARN